MPVVRIILLAIFAAGIGTAEYKIVPGLTASWHIDGPYRDIVFLLAALVGYGVGIACYLAVEDGESLAGAAGAALGVAGLAAIVVGGAYFVAGDYPHEPLAVWIMFHQPYLWTALAVAVAAEIIGFLAAWLTDSH